MSSATEPPVTSSASREKKMRATAAAPLCLALALAFGPATADAEPKTLTVIGHAVHQRVLTTGAGGDVQAEWAEPNEVTVEWLTFDVQGVHDRLFREASLSQGSADLGLVANRYVSPAMTGLFMPLDDFLASAPIEDFDEIAPGMRETITFDGKLYGIPMRHATAGLHYNEELLAERGFDRPPETFEEFLEYARELTYTRADGTQVHGLVLDGPRPPLITDMARAYDGDFLTTDYQLRANEPAMVRTIETLRDFYRDGVLPRAYLTFTTEDTITFMQQGRAAMAITPFGRYANFNDAGASRFPGKFKVVALPISEELAGELDVTPARTEFWAFVIPQNSQQPELAWELIRHASSKESTIRAAVNGNGPVRPSAYDDPRVQGLVPYAAAEAQVLAVARPPLPGFENAARAEDIFVEEFSLVLLGRKEPQAAMDEVVRRVAPLLEGQ
jgi:multiple sugar transport system substrate-binding protein